MKGNLKITARNIEKSIKEIREENKELLKRLAKL